MYPQNIQVANTRLNRVMYKEAARCASVSEYAQASGLKVDEVIATLKDLTTYNILKLEPVGAEIFVHTAPTGRHHIPRGQGLPPNLWELLRQHGNEQTSYELWKIYRGLEHAGWRVEAHTQRIITHLARLDPVPQLAIYFNNSIVPLLLHPPLDSVHTANGPLHSLLISGAKAVGIVIPEGSLDDYETEVRSYQQDNQTPHGVILLETPAYHPVTLQPSDAAIPTTGVGYLSNQVKNSNDH